MASAKVIRLLEGIRFVPVVTMKLYGYYKMRLGNSLALLSKDDSSSFSNNFY